MDTVGTGSASQFRLYERQLGWKPPCPRRGRRPSISGTRFMANFKGKVSFDKDQLEKGS